jgi:hypothetical protein
VLHVLDHCSLYARHWEGWLSIPTEKDKRLKALARFLVENPTAFAFVDAPRLIEDPYDRLISSLTNTLRDLQLNDPQRDDPNGLDLV